MSAPLKRSKALDSEYGGGNSEAHIMAQDLEDEDDDDQDDASDLTELLKKPQKLFAKNEEVKVPPASKAAPASKKREPATKRREPEPKRREPEPKIPEPKKREVKAAAKDAAKSMKTRSSCGKSRKGSATPSVEEISAVFNPMLSNDFAEDLRQLQRENRDFYKQQKLANSQL